MTITLTFGLALCAAACAATAALTALARRYALNRQLMDVPGERRSHRVATPRGGGIAIAAITLFAMVWLGLIAETQARILLSGACGLALVAVIGWIDDHRPLSPLLRLGVHFVAATVLALAVFRSGGAAWWALAICALSLGLINVWNFMDGINGTATLQAALVAVACLLFGARGEAALLCALFAAACVGFLPFNFPHARIFLGDVGSGALGYTVACLIALHGAADPVRALLWLLPLSAFLIDAALTLLSRIIQRERWWTPHVQHVYQRCVQAGHSHAVVAGGYAVWTLISILLVVWLAGAPRPVIIGVFATWYLLGVAIWLNFRVRHARRMRLS